MQHQPVSGAPLPRRIWRAVAIGFSVTALALNYWSLSGACASGEAAKRASTNGIRAAKRVTAAPSREVLSQVNALTDRGDGPALESLIDLAIHGSRSVASAALTGIAQIGGDRARSFLAQRFRDASDLELPSFAGALAQLGDAQSRELLRQAARSPRSSARAAALEALSTLDTIDVRDFMLNQLTTADPTVSVSYFSDCRDPRALPALERLAREAPLALRRSVVDALFAQGALAQPAITRLLRVDEQTSNVVLDTRPTPLGARLALRQASIERLRAGAITTGSVFDFLEQDLSDESREALLRAAREPASAERALSALATRGDRASRSALAKLGNDSDRGLAARAACALQSQLDSRTQQSPLRFAKRGT